MSELETKPTYTCPGLTTSTSSVNVPPHTRRMGHSGENVIKHLAHNAAAGLQTIELERRKEMAA